MRHQKDTPTWDIKVRHLKEDIKRMTIKGDINMRH